MKLLSLRFIVIFSVCFLLILMVCRLSLVQNTKELHVTKHPDMWESLQFTEIDNKLKKAVIILDDFYSDDEGFPLYQYNLIATFGSDVKKESSFLGGYTNFLHQYTVAYGTNLPKGISFLEYDDAEKTAKIKPSQFDRFMEWVNNIDRLSLDEKETEQTRPTNSN